MPNDGLSDFMKNAYSKGRVKELREAFEEFPPEEEWHEGKIENVLCESSQEYSIYEVGDIVFVKEYYYKDGTKGENHLFVIIDKNNVVIPIEHFGMIISSRIEKAKYKTNKLLLKDNKNKLKKDSIVKTDYIYIIKSDEILFKIGKVDINKVKEYKKSFLESLE